MTSAGVLMEFLEPQNSNGGAAEKGRVKKAC